MTSVSIVVAHMSLIRAQWKSFR